MTNQISFTPSTAGDQVYPVQYIEETTYGSKVTASPAYTAVKVAGDLTPKIDGVELEVNQAGSYTRYSSQSAGHDDGFTLDIQPVDIGILKYGTNAVTYKDTSIQIPIVYQQSEGTAGLNTYYMFALGAKCNSVTLSTTGRGLASASTEWICREWTKASQTSGLTTPTFVTFGSYSDAVLSNVDSGNLPFTLNGVTYGVQEFSITWNNNLIPVTLIGADEGRIEALKLGHITITGSVKIPAGYNLNIEGLSHDFPQTGATAKMVFKSGTMVCNMTQFKVMSRDQPVIAAQTDIRSNTINFECSTATLGTS